MERIQMKEEVKSLWKRCFNDCDEFVDLYFNMRYKDDINRAMIEDGHVVSALQAIPYPMTYYGHVVNMAYISGACTHPDFRSHGVMRQLLKKTHRLMYEEHVFLSTLIPAEDWLRGYYARSGYAVCFYYGETSLSFSGLSGSDTDCDIELYKDAEDEVYPYFQKMMARRPNCVQHTQDDFRIIWADWHLGGGLVLVARRKSQIVGLAFVVEEKGFPVIKEMFWDTPAIKDMLCRKVLSLYGQDKLVYIHEADASAFPLGMARVISVKEMLALYAATHPEETFFCHLQGDEAIPENNGYYMLQQGECIKKMSPGKVYVSHTVESLTHKLFCMNPPYMSLMLN